MRQVTKIIHIQFVREIDFHNFFLNKAGKRSLLFSLRFPKVLEWYVYYQKI